MQNSGPNQSPADGALIDGAVPQDRARSETGLRSAANRRKSGTKIKVTPEIIEAGLEVFLSDYPDTGVGDVLDRKMVRGIFLAMLKFIRD